uniref:Uncharacterized protein n=1 Tax=Romanomermis culicivorax TaxID=13658 RepID=A0A915J328_ROMCU
MAIQFGLQKDDSTAPEMEAKVVVLEPPSPMKVDDDIASDKLVIDETIAERPESEMTESKEDGKVPCDSLIHNPPSARGTLPCTITIYECARASNEKQIMYINDFGDRTDLCHFLKAFYNEQERNLGILSGIRTRRQCYDCFRTFMYVISRT